MTQILAKQIGITTPTSLYSSEPHTELSILLSALKGIEDAGDATSTIICTNSRVVICHIKQTSPDLRYVGLLSTNTGNWKK